MLKASNTLSSLARMLNTKDLQFELTGDSVVDRKIRFSLSPERKTLYDALLLESNGVQKEIITQLFHAATEKINLYLMNLQQVVLLQTLTIL